MRSCLLKFLVALALFPAAAFAITCPGGAPCLDLNTQAKGSRMPFWGTDSGSANAYAITTLGDIGSGGVLQTGSRFYFKAANANTTASTLAVNGGTAIAIKKNVSTALASGDIALNQVIEVTYDGTNFQLVGNGALSFANISGSLACSQMPAGTGDVTWSAGSCVTTLATVTVPKGGTGQTSLTAHNFVLGEGSSVVAFLSLGAHQVPMGAASADPSAKTVPDCQDTGGNHLNFTQSTDGFSCGTSSSGGGGGGGGALTKICALTASASASLDFTSGNCGGTNVFTSTYIEYVVKVTSLVLNTNTADVAMLVSTNGSTFVSTGYLERFLYFQLDGGGTPNYLNSTTEIQLDNSYGTGLTRNSLSGTIEVHDPLAATDKAFEFTMILANSTPAWFRFTGGAVYDSASTILAFQIKPSAGTITSGTVTIYGYQK
jgi:hypothetical protein